MAHEEEPITKNYNKLIELKSKKRTPAEEGEYARRESMQERYVNARTDKEREKIKKEVKESF